MDACLESATSSNSTELESRVPCLKFRFPVSAVAPNPEPSPMPQHVEGPNIMNSLRGGAGSFFKRLGDTSSKVIQIAQQ